MAGGEPKRRGKTREALVDSAVAELLAVGQADFAMERVAKRAFFSVGSVYERWADRASLLADIAADPIATDITTALGRAPDAASSITWVLDDGCDQVLLGSEILLAGQTMPAVREASLAVWQALYGGLSRHLPPSMAWYVATYAVGNALLGVLGLPGPQPARGRVTWIVDACAASTAPVTSGPTQGPDDVVIPVVPAPSGSDDVALALIDAARVLLREHGAVGTSTREIATGAGVGTGALYRRYEGKSRLLADVLLAQLEPDRYTWTWDLVRALASGNPYGEAAAVIAHRMITMARDLPTQRVLLQVGIAARNDPALRAQIAERVGVADQARVDMVEHFMTAGILRRDVSPGVFAWGFQTIPVGTRATLPLGIPLDEGTVAQAMYALLAAAAAAS